MPLAIPHARSVPSRVLAAVFLAALLSGAGACGEDLDAVNQPARVTSVGPVVPQEFGVYIQYSLWDLEGDDQNLDIEICEADNADADTCPTPVRGAGGDGTHFVPTVPADSDVPHRFSWNVGCGRVEDDSCVASDLQTEYVARIAVQHDDGAAAADALRSEPFTLAEVGLDEIPTCDPSGATIPAPCAPDDTSMNP